MLPQQVQERLTQKSCNRLMNFCTGSIPWSKKSCQSQCSCKHPSTDDDGNSSFLSFGKVGENWKKTWRKYRENMWNILVLPSFFCSGLKLYKRFRWNVIYILDLRFLRFSDMCRLHLSESNVLDASIFLISACSP